MGVPVFSGYKSCTVSLQSSPTYDLPIFHFLSNIHFYKHQMANLQVSCIPKNPELLWLQGPQNQHRSYNLFTHGVENPLKARRCDIALFNHMKSLQNQDIEEEVFKYIRDAGFGGVFKTGFHKIDHQLIIALVERWRPETHTFHFPTGEATITLQDVQVIWGLPIDGPPVSGTWAYMDTDNWIVMCQDYLGFVPEDEEIKAGKIKISTLVEHLSYELENADEDAYQQRARIYLLAMFAGHLFVDSNQYDVSLNFMENIDDLRREGRKSWGSAVIASLYRNLCKATHPGTKGIQGPLLLLQYWAWERMPHISPRIIRGDTYNYEHCYAARWHFTLSHTETPAHVRVAYRSIFTALTDEHFRWTPYEGIVHLLPDDCRDGRDIWAYSGWVVFWSTVEPHLADRVARQFGYMQTIPINDGLLSPQEHTEVHGIKRVGGRNTDWLHKLRKYVDYWNNRRNRVFQGVEGVTTAGNYMQWYYDRTVLCVTNPGQPSPPNQYPSWGAEQQLYREGFREIADRARHLIEREPTQSQILQDFVHLPQQIMQYGHSAERMSYSSQNFEFPASGYHPGPPGGAYHQGTQWCAYQGTPGGASSSGNHPIFRNTSSNMNFITPSPSNPFNPFGASSNTFASDFGMDPDFQHFHTGRQMAHVTPLPMRDFSAPVTNLGNDDEDDDDDEMKVLNYEEVIGDVTDHLVELVGIVKFVVK